MEPEPTNTEETQRLYSDQDSEDRRGLEFHFNYSVTNNPEVVTDDFEGSGNPDGQPQTDEQKLEANCGNLNVLD